MVQDFLAAGDNYRHAYAAAFRYDHLAGLRQVRVPTVAMARADDLLFQRLDLLTELPDCVTVRRLGTDDNSWAAAMAEALAAGAVGSAPKRARDRRRPARWKCIGFPAARSVCYGAPAHWRAPACAAPAYTRFERAQQTGLALALSAGRQVITLDLPGFGATALSGLLDVDRIAIAVHASLLSIGVQGFDVVALGKSGSIGAALAGLSSGARLVLVDPVPDQAREAVREHMVDVSPRIHGSHLLAAWHQLRDMALWRPGSSQLPPMQLMPGRIRTHPLCRRF